MGTVEICRVMKEMDTLLGEAIDLIRNAATAEERGKANLLTLGKAVTKLANVASLLARAEARAQSESPLDIQAALKKERDQWLNALNEAGILVHQLPGTKEFHLSLVVQSETVPTNRDEAQNGSTTTIDSLATAGTTAKQMPTFTSKTF